MLLRIAQPASNHNGGHLAFGPDGYLYIASGDGGGSGGEAAQDPGSRLGKLLRIDVDRRGAGRAYGIPADNPWAREDGPAAEIWALGLRNSWRFSFDGATGDLAIGDVGGSAWEEIDREVWSATGGRNYGWPRWEGFEERREKVDLAPRSPRAEPPVLVYPHEDGDCAVTGGQVYRGQTLPWLRGAYVFADYCSGRLWSALPDAARRGRWRRQLLLDTGLSVAHVGSDSAGERILPRPHRRRHPPPGSGRYAGALRVRAGPSESPWARSASGRPSAAQGVLRAADPFGARGRRGQSRRRRRHRHRRRRVIDGSGTGVVAQGGLDAQPIMIAQDRRSVR